MPLGDTLFVSEASSKGCRYENRERFGPVWLDFLAPAVMAQSVFDGTWWPDRQIFSPTRKPDVIELANDVYDCQSCTPPYKIKADGHDQGITGNPYYDTLSITMADDGTVTKIAKKGGKVVTKTKGHREHRW